MAEKVSVPTFGRRQTMIGQAMDKSVGVLAKSNPYYIEQAVKKWKEENPGKPVPKSVSEKPVKPKSTPLQDLDLVVSQPDNAIHEFERSGSSEESSETEEQEEKPVTSMTVNPSSNIDTQ